MSGVYKFIHCELPCFIRKPENTFFSHSSKCGFQLIAGLRNKNIQNFP